MITIPKSYRAPRLLQNGHISTIASHLMRFPAFRYTERWIWTTPDDDELQLDVFQQQSDRLMVLLHGLEGNSNRAYMRGMAKVAASAGWDVLALNFRSCGGSMNRLARFYHSGDTGDLRWVLNRVVDEMRYRTILPVGFSLGGNVLLKYLGEESAKASNRIKSAMAVSAPLDLASSAVEIEKPANRLYLNRFLRSLKRKATIKMERFPGAADWKAGLAARTFHAFDDAVTAPLHGFDNVHHYYREASSLAVLQNITVPTVIINARNDSFLSGLCYPELNGGQSGALQTVYPLHGGHVGFLQWPGIKSTYPEMVMHNMLQSGYLQ